MAQNWFLLCFNIHAQFITQLQSDQSLANISFQNSQTSFDLKLIWNVTKNLNSVLGRI